MGTRILDITSKKPQTDRFGFSPELAGRNATIKGESEIINISEKDFEKFEVIEKIDFDAQVNKGLKRASIRDYVASHLPLAIERPDLLNPTALLEEEAKQVPGIEWSKVRGGTGEKLKPAMSEALPTLANQGSLPINSPLNIPTEA